MAGRGRPTWTPERSARLVSMLDLGLSVARAAEIIGTTPNACYIHLKRIGHAPPTGFRTIAGGGHSRRAEPMAAAEWHNVRWPGAKVPAPDLCPVHLARLIKYQHIFAGRII